MPDDDDLRPEYDLAALERVPGGRGKYYPRSALGRAAAVPDGELRVRYEQLLVAACMIGTLAGAWVGCPLLTPAQREAWRRVFDLAHAGTGLDFEEKT